MSNYTPTTEEVRTAYTSYTQPSLSDNGQLFYGDRAEFDRWLESVMQEAYIAERERIIKLLEEKYLEIEKHYNKTWSDFAVAETGGMMSALKDAIALIKGEK